MAGNVSRTAIAFALLIGLYLCTVSMAHEPLRPQTAPWRLWFRSARIGSPNGVSVGPPGPQRYPQYAGGNYPWYGYGLGVPTYNWGYFGANAHGTLLTGFRGYHDNYWQFSVQRGY